MQVVDALDPLVDLRRVLVRILDRPCTADEIVASIYSPPSKPFTTSCSFIQKFEDSTSSLGSLSLLGLSFEYVLETKKRSTLKKYLPLLGGDTTR